MSLSLTLAAASKDSITPASRSSWFSLASTAISSACSSASALGSSIKSKMYAGTVPSDIFGGNGEKVTPFNHDSASAVTATAIACYAVFVCAVGVAIYHFCRANAQRQDSAFLDQSIFPYVNRYGVPMPTRYYQV